MLVPVDRFTAECGTDACGQSGPKNAVNFSTGSMKGGGGPDERPFLFTYKNECYMTETEAFCGLGKVARVTVSHKSPFCVPRDYEECIQIGATSPVRKIPCAAGLVEESERNVCMSGVEVD